jgi:hypothetical protein
MRLIRSKQAMRATPPEMAVFHGFAASILARTR